LASHALWWSEGTPLPTLRQMIEQHHNVVILAESGAKTDKPWYIPAYKDMLQDTPFNFNAPTQFSCELARGNASNPLLLVNHWLDINPPSPSAAVKVNSLDALAARVQQCEDLRHRKPNIVAVDFYASGDLVPLVDDLNGVGAKPA